MQAEKKKEGEKVVAAEKNFENRVKKFLKEQGCYFIKYWGGAAYTKSGVPDLLVCCNGHFVGIEVKAEKGKPSELQIYNLREIDKAGGYGVLLYPEDFEQFKVFIEYLNKLTIKYAAEWVYKGLKSKWKHFENKFNQRKE